MLRFIIIVTILQRCLLQTECLFCGDECYVDGQFGVCLPVSECRTISNEVRRAGNPVPLHMRTKLQNLTCGFIYSEPLICCATLGLDESEFERNFHNVPINPGFSRGEGTYNFVGEDKANRDNIETSTNRPSDPMGPSSVDEHPNLGLLPRKCGSIESDRILGGNRTKLYELPWMVLLSYDTSRGIKLSCGGTIINKWYILTAAHCVTFLRKMRLDGVIIGEYDVRSDPDCEILDGREDCAPNVVNATIDTIIAHPGYTRQTLVDDIALIRLSQPIDFTRANQQPICLPISRELQSKTISGLNGVVAGWGVTEDGMQSPVLLSVDLPILSPDTCEIAYNGSLRISEKQLCAGGIKDKDSCGGDSGGPLLYPGQYGSSGLRYIQHGIVSYGSKRCGIAGFPGVYTNVAHYMDWILDNIRS